MAISEHRFQVAMGLASRAPLQPVLDPLGEGWRVVPAQGGGGRVVVHSPTLRHADLVLVQQAVRAVRLAGARSDEHAKMVLHIDGARFEARTMQTLQSLMAKQAALLARVLGRPLEQVGFAAVKGGPFGRTGLEIVLNATLHAGDCAASIVLMLAIVERALCARAASRKPRPFDEAGAKYDFRCFLLRLGLVGEEYREAREDLLRRLPGSAAWKRGRPPRPERPRRAWPAFA